MRLKRQYFYLLRGSPVTFIAENVTSKVEGKPAVLSRKGENMDNGPMNQLSMINEKMGIV